MGLHLYVYTNTWLTISGKTCSRFLLKTDSKYGEIQQSLPAHARFGNLAVFSLKLRVAPLASSEAASQA